jgi:biotin carboxylase
MPERTANEGQRTICIVGAGAEAADGIAVARRMGLHVVATDADPEAPGFAVSHDRILASTYDVDATVAAVADYHRRVRRVDGVLCIASDVPLTVAHVARAIGVPGLTLETARLASDKLAMKERLAADGVQIPAFAPVASARELGERVARHGLPLVVKPVDSRGARGVLRLDADVEIGWAYAFAKRHSPSGRVMVERFLDGPQVSTESLVVDGTVHTVGMSDRNYELLERFAPHMIENGGALPTRHGDATRRAIHELVARAAGSLGIENGVVKGDVVVHDGVPHIIEVAARLSGGRFCSHEIPLATGVDWVRHAIRVALGERPTAEELRPRYQRGVAQRYVFPSPGRVTAVHGAEAASRGDGIAWSQVRLKPGDVVGPIHSHPARGGSVIACAETREQAVARAVAAVRAIRIEVEPLA